MNKSATEYSTGLKRRDLPAWWFDMMPQASVKLALLPGNLPHNSIWDLAVVPKHFRRHAGRMFLSLCSEGQHSASARVYEYLPRTGSFRLCFDVAQECLVWKRAVPPSKIHSSMGFTADGRMIMTTHNTAPAPSHPAWMFGEYYSHQWEGYAGSNILTYDLESGLVQNLGVPVPRDSIYGAIFDSKHHALYFMTFLRGHLCRFDLRTRQVDDLGQVTEVASFRLVVGPDGHIYGSSRAGWLFKVDVDKRRVEDLGVSFADNRNRWNAMQRNLHHACVGPDDRIYMTAVYTDELYAYDTRKKKLETIGHFEPEPRIEAVYPRSVMGLHFDRHGILWYAQRTQAKGAEGMWLHLTRWDCLRKRPPEIVGLIGRASRTPCAISEMSICGDTLYAADTNHGSDAPGLIVVDLNVLRRDLHAAKREICRDPLAYMTLEDGARAFPGKNFKQRIKPYADLLTFYSHTMQFMAGNRLSVRADKVLAIRLWRTIAPEQSSVQSLRWQSDNALRGICGAGRQQWQFTIQDGAVSAIRKITPAAATRQQSLDRFAPERLPAWIARTAMPFHPGRQYLAEITCWAPWKDKTILVGTRGGWLALVNLTRRTACALGTPAAHGPVRQIVTNASGSRAYGLAGDDMDIDRLFQYDARLGLRPLGRIVHTPPDTPFCTASPEPVCLALSPDETMLAVGCAGRMGCVYIYTGL